MKLWPCLGAALLGLVALPVSSVARTQRADATDGMDVSAATCDTAYRFQWSGYVRTPASDGRPGYKFYNDGIRALCGHDYAHALHMFKIAGSWGYKPAEYSVGVMYLRGAGMAADIPLGAAWMKLAADSGIPEYVKMRDMLLKLLQPGQLSQMRQHYAQLEPTYGDAGVRRARWWWHVVGSGETGSHLGHPMASVTSSLDRPLSSYYREFGQSDDPYARLDGFLTGAVTVGALEQIGTGGDTTTVPDQPARGQQPPPDHPPNHG